VLGSPSLRPFFLESLLSIFGPYRWISVLLLILDRVVTSGKRAKKATASEQRRWPVLLFHKPYGC